MTGGDVDLTDLWQRTLVALERTGVSPSERAFVGFARLMAVVEQTALIAVPNDYTKKVLESDVRVECGYDQGQDVTPHYDPLLAKVIVHAATRGEAIDRLMKALRAFRIEGVRNNVPALLEILDSPEFRAGDVHTGLLADVMKQAVRA